MTPFELYAAFGAPLVMFLGCMAMVLAQRGLRHRRNQIASNTAISPR